jgi:hypothetical protein
MSQVEREIAQRVRRRLSGSAFVLEPCYHDQAYSLLR